MKHLESFSHTLAVCLFVHRMTGLLSKSMEGMPPANAGGGGWSMSEVMNFLHYMIPLNEDEGNRSDSEETDDHDVRNLVQKFDAVVFRVMHGWMKR